MKIRTRHTGAMILPLCLSAMAGAQSMLEEVIVTAERREGTLQDAPISMVAMGSQELQQMSAFGLSDIAHSVPNLQQINFSVGNTTLRFYIRGIGQTDSQPTSESPVGVYLDGVYIARTSGLALSIPDLERIEVLRGPQGTLFGRNTTGGAINMVTTRPEDRFRFSQILSLGNYNAVRSSTVINVPVTDTLAAKFTYMLDKRDGTIRNLGVGDDFNTRDTSAYRVDLRWRPTDHLTVDYAYDKSRHTTTADLIVLDKVAEGFAGVLPEQRSRPKRARLPAPMRDSDTDVEGHALTVSLDTGAGEFKSISAYRTLDLDAYQDQSGNPDIDIFRNELLLNAQNQISQELQWFGSLANDSIDYVAGLYYLRERARERAVDEIFGSLIFPRRISAENTSYAAYTSWTWTPGGPSPWSFTLGGRYSVDKREADNFIDPEVSSRYSRFTPSLVIDYRINDTVSVYGKIASGYSAGGYNMRAAVFTNDFGPETLSSYELGWKSELLERRLRLNAAVFYSDYDDIQFTVKVSGQPEPTLTHTTNAGKAEIYGAEVDASWMILDNLIASISYGYLGSKFKDVPPLDDGIPDDPDRFHASNAPRHSARTTLQWDIGHFEAGRLSYFLEYNWRDHSYTTPRHDPPGDDSIPAFGLMNMRLTLARENAVAGGDLSISLWARNILDKEHFVDSANAFRDLHANRVVRYGDPRTYGIEFRFDY